MNFLILILRMYFLDFSFDMADQNMESGPHMEVIDRVRNIPVVQSAIEKTGSTYTNVKDSHYLINWALSYAEAGLTYATATAAPIASPIAKKFEGQINAVDQKLCEGLDIVQDKLPIVKEPPKQVKVLDFSYKFCITIFLQNFAFCKFSKSKLHNFEI